VTRSILAAVEVLRRRDRLDPASGEHRELDRRLYEALLCHAAEADLRGLEAWYANGLSREGRVVRVEESAQDGPVLVFDSLEAVLDDEGNEVERHARRPLRDVLASGWLQEPDEVAEGDGYTNTIRALARRRRRP
jgi:hypothetical protein